MTLDEYEESGGYDVCPYANADIKTKGKHIYPFYQKGW